jgi:hypothetical protein
MVLCNQGLVIVRRPQQGNPHRCQGKNPCKILARIREDTELVSMATHFNIQEVIILNLMM